MNSIIVWSGKSLIDGKKIVVIATGLSGNSQNEKTGKMVQCYIMRRDINPILARFLHEDRSVCGDCKHRFWNTCYVNLGQAVSIIFNKFHNDEYRHIDNDFSIFKDKSVRLGAYGDPAAVPFEVWEKIAKQAKNVTGYTHQWKNCDTRLKQYCMASVDSIDGYTVEYEQAKKMGWRTFRVFATDKQDNVTEYSFDNEIMCPASNEAGKKTTCEKCNLCCGNEKENSKNVMILVHGGNEKNKFWKSTRFYNMMKKIKSKKKWKTEIDYNKIKSFVEK